MKETRHHFSKRTSWDLSRSSFSLAIAQAREAGRELFDLTASNPTQCGFDYDAAAILEPLSSVAARNQALVYDPDPRGMRSAREAVVRYYADYGATIDADSLILTTSTSEAYSYLFRLLCDPGDEVLVAQPSYPLFEFLADLDDVKLRPYPLFYDFGWWIDFAELEKRITPQTRAILVVNPNNPTGHWTHDPERARLEELCEEHGLALIVDEVFLDYPVSSQGTSFASGPHKSLTFVLSGISKVAALPQMKVAWIASFGPPTAVAEALSRLEMIADTFLSMNTLAQLALPLWLANRAQIQDQIRGRVAANLALLQASGIETLQLEAGWSAVLRLHADQSEDRNFGRGVAAALLEASGVLVHPGDFYGMADDRLAVVSLIVPVDTFRQGVDRIRALSLDEP